MIFANRSRLDELDDTATLAMLVFVVGEGVRVVRKDVLSLIVLCDVTVMVKKNGI